MAGQRTPGVFGLLDDGFPSLDVAWSKPAERSMFPTGPALDAQFPHGVVGLETPSHEELLARDDDEAGEYSPPDRYRDIEVQGTVVKVRCNPRWLIMGKDLAYAQEEDPQARQGFLKLVRRHKPERRAEIASLLNPLFRSKRKRDIADELERLAHDS